MCVPRRSGLACTQPWPQRMGLGVLLLSTPSSLPEAASLPRPVHGWLTLKEGEVSIYPLTCYTPHTHTFRLLWNVNFHSKSFKQLLIRWSTFLDIKMPKLRGRFLICSPFISECSSLVGTVSLSVNPGLIKKEAQYVEHTVRLHPCQHRLGHIPSEAVCPYNALLV